ncbi:MAG: 3-deoxy-manno-octulosonate cytidylyltransferase [Planctomyces sp.]|nr:3-deoxy-manno-octulosonate cytidylyltransferase [Planctomyces sp.]
MKTYGVIPARLQSTRLPRKLLLAETGRPLLQYAWEAACRATSLDEVLIAADSPELAEAATKFGAQVELTGEHPSGTDRIAEVVRRRCGDAELVVNLQGDEPDMDPADIDRLVMAMESRPEVEMGTLSTTIHSRALLEDRACVKVVCAADGRALYFSRLPIPCSRDESPDELLQGDSPWRLHLGIYAYRPTFLEALTQLPPSRLEQLEKLEQLRALEAGASILVVNVRTRTRGIDTAEDYLAFVERMRGRTA